MPGNANPVSCSSHPAWPDQREQPSRSIAGQPLVHHCRTGTEPPALLVGVGHRATLYDGDQSSPEKTGITASRLTLDSGVYVGPAARRPAADRVPAGCLPSRGSRGLSETTQMALLIAAADDTGGNRGNPPRGGATRTATPCARPSRDGRLDPDGRGHDHVPPPAGAISPASVRARRTPSA
jgi:hypothetical protein